MLTLSDSDPTFFCHVGKKIEPVEGFDVFKSSKKSRSKGKEVEHDTKDKTLENPKKELYRRMEVRIEFHLKKAKSDRVSVSNMVSV